MKLTVYSLIFILTTIGLLLIQNLEMYFFSKQYREVGYIEYGSFLNIGSIVEQVGILVCPFVCSVFVYWNYGKRACKNLIHEGDRIFICVLLVGLFSVLVLRTLVIAIQGYALIFI
jgi:hypothetical protein